MPSQHGLYDISCICSLKLSSTLLLYINLITYVVRCSRAGALSDFPTEFLEPLYLRVVQANLILSILMALQKSL